MRARAIEALKSRGVIPVFPLPDLVFFPHASLPLHIFEPRYRQMVEDALRGDRMIAMALLKPGWERGYGGHPDIFPLACAGLIEEEARLPDGRFNIRLRGLTRVEVLSFETDSPYRVARVRVLEDRNEFDGPGVEEDKKRLFASCSGLLQEISGRTSQPLALESDIPFASVVNTLCQSLAMETPLKMALLGLDDVRERCRLLVRVLEERWRDIALQQAASGDPAGGDVH
jgi:Lon protease-like protein